MEFVSNLRCCYWKIFIFISCLKILLIPTYKSTDFEVHRNWLAITYSLPVKEWFTNVDSVWTLDYPPFFAWFEWCLSQIAQYVNKEMLITHNIDFSSDDTIIFLRFTVIVTDLIYALGLKRCLDACFKTQNCQRLMEHYSDWGRIVELVGQFIAPFLLLCNFGLLLVDHIHFQYNGLLFGMLFLSFSFILQGRYYTGAALFIILLNFKHIFLYAAPAYALFYFLWIINTSANNGSKSKKFTAFTLLTALDNYLTSENFDHTVNLALSKPPIPPNFIPETFAMRQRPFFNNSNGITNVGKINGVPNPSNGHVDSSKANDYFNEPKGNKLIKYVIIRILILVFITLTIFGASFGPFAYMGQFKQVLTRLFPFQRGLRHDYWAPNLWSLYGIVDKVLSFRHKDLVTESLIPLNEPEPVNATIASAPAPPGLSSLHKNHNFLYEITPAYTFIITIILFFLPFISTLYSAIKSFLIMLKGDTAPKQNIPTAESIILYVAWACAVSFFAGYHVHEKACLMITLPLTLYYCLTLLKYYTYLKISPATRLNSDSNTYQTRVQRFFSVLTMALMFMSLATNFALLPLIFTRREELIKLSLFVLYHAVALKLFRTIRPSGSIANGVYNTPAASRCHSPVPMETKDDHHHSFTPETVKINECFMIDALLKQYCKRSYALIKLYTLGILPIYIFSSWICPYLPLFATKYQFVPLALVSNYGALGYSISLIFLFRAIRLARQIEDTQNPEPPMTSELDRSYSPTMYESSRAITPVETTLPVGFNSGDQTRFRPMI